MPAPRLAHMVYFTLNDNSPAKVEEMVKACQKYLNIQPGILYFAAGTCDRSLDRPVNDLDWDVALHLVFVDRAAHDLYQTDPSHMKFIEEQKPGWSKVRVFDSIV